MHSNSVLVAHLREQDEHYRTVIQPLYPDTETYPDDGSDNFEDFDAARNEFLESLWDVVGQHFADERERGI